MCLNGRITKKDYQLYLSPIDLRPAQSQPAQVEAATQAVNLNLPQPVKEPVAVPTVVPPTAKNIPPPKEATPKVATPVVATPTEAPKSKKLKGKKLINVTQTVRLLKKRTTF